MGPLMDIKLKYLVNDTDRHGKVRHYVRVPGQPKVRLRGKPGSPEFLAAYNTALDDDTAAPGPARHGSLGWLCRQYYRSGDFKRLGARTRKVRRAILERVCVDNGDKPYARLEPRHVIVLRDDIADTPEAANSRVKALRQVYAFAIGVGHHDRNPVRDVPYLRSGSTGFHTWTIEEIRQYQDKHPLGTKARLTLDILLFTGARRSDAVTFGRQMVRQGWLHWTEAKGAAKLRKERAIPILPNLQRSLDACPSGHLSWLVTSFGKPFTANGFGNRFRKWCDEAGLPHCSAHGLRKAGATIAAENGATEDQLKAIFGWETSKEADRYTKKASRRKLAGDAMHLINVDREEQDEDENSPTLANEVSHREKSS